MSETLDPEKKQRIASRISYYRDLGIYDFYRRERDNTSSTAMSSLDSNEEKIRFAAPTIETSDSMNVMPRDSAPAVSEQSNSDVSSLLRIIREDIGECTRCKLHKLGRKQIVFGVGNPDAELMFVGEGPGADEDAQGEPFVGRAGQLLNKMIEAMGLKRSDVYIANVVKCRPPQNRTPERDECDTCGPFLIRQIQAIKPKAIVALGAVAAKTLLAMDDTMGRLRGRWYDFHGAQLRVTYHPAYLLRDPRQKAETWKDLQEVMKFLGLPIPAKTGEQPSE